MEENRIRAERRARQLEEYAQACRAEGDTREAEEAEEAAIEWRELTEWTNKNEGETR
jgi:hypothetical protein